MLRVLDVVGTVNMMGMMMIPTRCQTTKNVTSNLLRPSKQARHQHVLSLEDAGRSHITDKAACPNLTHRVLSPGQVTS